MDLLFGGIPETLPTQPSQSGGVADLFGFGNASAAYSAATGYVPPKTVIRIFYKI
jgi:hypothetical protein